MLQAITLGLVQGLTEFLPISSSAHLVLVSFWLGWPDQGLGFDTAANSGSLLAVIVYFRRDLWRLARAGTARLGGRRGDDRAAGRLAGRLVLATVPVALAGAALQRLVATGGRQPLLIAATSIGFGLLLGWADRETPRRGPGEARLESLGWRGALFVGLFQALALVPGTSRAGVTMTAARLLRLSRDEAVRFSFLLAVPVGLLVAARDLVDLAAGGAPRGGDPAQLAVGFLVSAAASYLAIHWLLGWVRRQSLQAFVVYRVVLGLAIVAGYLWS